MAVSEAKETNDINEEKRLFAEYPWFYENVYESLNDSIKNFFRKDYVLRFMGVSYNDENVLFYGDEYFVNKIPVNKASSTIIRISSELISSLLDNTLGLRDTPFSLDELTDVEAMLIKEFTVYMYKKIEDLYIKAEPNKKILKISKTYNFTFYAQYEEKHAGKIIVSVPDYLLNDNIEIEERENCFDISSFRNTPALVTLRFGSARISLNDIKAIEIGDVIVLDESNVNKMSLLWEGNIVDFNIKPNPALIISVDKTGGSEMGNEDALNSENMWDTILVDVVAEFDNFKLTLGELKQISEGLVIDVGSVYNNKIKLRVAKQVVASGELVILNDRYGVRIDTVKNIAEEEPEEISAEEQAARKAPPMPAAKNNKKQNQAQSANDEESDDDDDDENFDYSDFEIEDESI